MNTPDVITAQGKKLEVGTCYRYFGIWLVDSLPLKPQVDNCLSKAQLFIYDAILGNISLYICTLIEQRSDCSYSLRSQDFVLLSVPSKRVETA